MEEVYRRIGENIVRRRMRLGMSQSVLAGLIGRSESWVSQVERGVHKVDRLSVLVTLARALNVEVADLVDEISIVKQGNGPDLEGLQRLRRSLEIPDALRADDNGVDPDSVSAAPPAIDSGERRARHLIDLAYGHAQLAKDEDAVDRLLEADGIAHEEVRLNPRVRRFVGELLEREKPSYRSKIRTLAQRTGVRAAL